MGCGFSQSTGVCQPSYRHAHRNKAFAPKSWSRSCSVDSESETSSNLSHGLIQAFNVESRKIVSRFNVDIIQAIFDMTNVVSRDAVQEFSTHKGHIVKVLHKLFLPQTLIRQRFALLHRAPVNDNCWFWSQLSNGWNMRKHFWLSSHYQAWELWFCSFSIIIWSGCCLELD